MMATVTGMVPKLISNSIDDRRMAVVAFLRGQADAIEANTPNFEAAALVLLARDDNSDILTRTLRCNLDLLQLAGLLQLSLSDVGNL